MQITSRQLKLTGMFLFLLGLVSGLMMTLLKNPRMGLAAHLEGVMNGMFLVVAGIIWEEITLSVRLKKWCSFSLLYGCFANWFFTLLSAIWGTSKMTPVAGAGFSGATLPENLVAAGFVSVALTMVFSLVLIIYGLSRKEETAS